MEKTIGIEIAIDLETLSTEADAIVLSAGFAAFTRTGGLVATYYVEFGKEEQRAAERRADQATLDWWASQPEDVRQVVTAKGVPVIEALTGINQFFGRFDSNGYHIEGVWGYGSDFDNAILKSLYRSFGMELPWAYKQNRCGRTLAAVTGLDLSKITTTVKHHALEDAVWLAAAIRRCLMPQLF